MRRPPRWYVGVCLEWLLAAVFVIGIVLLVGLAR